LNELIHKRGWDSKTFNTGRTKLDPVTKKVLPIFATKLQNGLHDENADGSYDECDMSIEEVTDGVTYLRAKRGRWGQMRFGDSGHPNSFLVKIKNKGSKGVSFKYTGGTGSSMTANNGKPLCNFDNGISIESTPYYKGVKMNIIVNDPLTAPLEYPFSIKDYGQKYTFIEDADGGATLRGEDQDPISIKPPYAIDANGDIGHVTIHYTGMDGNLSTFKKVVDEAWFRQAAAPIRIDPDVTIEDGVDGGVIEDVAISVQSPDDNDGGAIRLRCNDFFNQGTESESSAVRVILTDYAGVTPMNGKFIVIPIFRNADYDGKAHKLLKPFIESEATWNSYATGLSWDTSGAQETGGGTPDRSATVESTFTLGALTVPVDVDISAATLTEWIDVVNHGLLLRNDTGADGEFNHVGASEDDTYPIQFYMEFTEGGINRIAGSFGIGKMGVR
jgi:hypothetical protein